jgi:hypothetical protein
VDGLTFDFSGAIKYVSTVPDGDGKTHRINVLESLVLGESIWTIDEQRRNYTIMVVVPRDIRQFFQYGNKALWVVDITSSQPLLHVLLYPNDCEEKKKYQSIVEEGRFWNFMNDAAGKPFDLSNPDQKDEFKECIYREVFYSRPESSTGVTARFAVIFKREFPILWAEINDHKQPSKRKPASLLARAMQLTEAEAVADAIMLLKDKPYPLISIHDAIATTKDGLAEVEETLRQQFITANLRPRLAVKRLTIDGAEHDSLVKPPKSCTPNTLDRLKIDSRASEIDSGGRLERQLRTSNINLKNS